MNKIPDEDLNNPRVRNMFILYTLTLGSGVKIQDRKDAVNMVLRYGQAFSITEEEINKVLDMSVAEVLSL